MTQEQEHDRDQKPVPDPTSLTTQQLYREIATVEKFLVGQIVALGARIETRLDGMRELNEQRFSSQKEAAAKVEERFSKEIQTLSDLVSTKTEGLEREFRAKLESAQSFQSRMGAGE